VVEAWEQFGNPEEREHPLLEAVTRGLVITVTEDTVSGWEWVCVQV
jgi:hypothetical protein